MPKYVVLQLLPQGQRPGELVDLHEDVGNVFLSAGVVRVAKASDLPEQASTDAVPRRRYNRRDLQAKD